MVDMVNNPPHYKQGAIECIEAIRAALTPEEFRGYCKGNSIKYVWRELHKGGDESLKKAVWYMLQIGERATTVPDAAYTGTGGAMIRCHDCIAEHCACVAQ